MTPSGEIAEHVRYLTARLSRVNRDGRVDPDLVDLLLSSLAPLLQAHVHHGATLARAALSAVEAQNDLARAVLDDHLRRALEVYLSLPSDPVHHRRPHMAGEL